MGYDEAVVRDSLVRDLSVLEPGLEFVATEVGVRSARGAGGRIDVLARDASGMTVVVEVKVRTGATREAVHEVTKYAGAFAETHGMGPEDVRCIVASTQWHELIQSFSELHRVWDYSLDGYALSVSDDGDVVSAQRVRAHERGKTLVVCPYHLVFPFETGAERDLHVPRLAAGLEALGVQDHLVLSLDHAGADHRVGDPFCAYLAFAALTERPPLDDDDDDDEYWAPESDLLSQLLRDVPSSMVEEAGPGTLPTMADWTLVRARRGGRFRSDLAWSDEALLRRVTGEGVAVSARFEAACRPRDEARFARLRSTAAVQLASNPYWSSVVDLGLSLSSRDPEGLVELYVYDLEDVFLVLQSAQRRDKRAVPLLHYRHSGRSGDSFAIYGGLVWSGRVRTTDWSRLLLPFGGDVSGYAAHRLSGATATGNEDALEVLGLRHYAVLERGGVMLELTSGAAGVEVGGPARPQASVEDLLRAHPGLSSWLDTDFSTYVPYFGDA